MIDNLAQAWISVLAIRSLGLTSVWVGSAVALESLALQGLSGIVITAIETERQDRDSPALAAVRRILLPAGYYSGVDAGPLPEAWPDQPPLGGHILYTSGATGANKAVLERGGIEDERDRLRAAQSAIDRGSIGHLANFTPAAGGGYRYPLAFWNAGASVILDQAPDHLGRTFRYNPSHAWATPGNIREVMRATAPISGAALRTRLIAIGGALSAGAAEAALVRAGASLWAYFGATEIAAGVMQSLVTAPEDVLWLHPIAPQPIEIVDDEGRLVPHGRQGDLRIRLTELDAQAYLNDPAASARVFRDGCFHTGDIALRRADGAVRILGRAGDVLMVQGQKLAVAPLEEAVQRALGVDAVCLLSGLTCEGVDELVVVLEAAGLPPREALDRVATDFHAFESVRFEVVPRFPRTGGAMAKVARPALRALVTGS